MRHFCRSRFMTRRHPTRASRRLWPFGAFVFVLAYAAPVYCQAGSGDPFNAPGNTTSDIRGYQSHGGAMLLITVYSENQKTKLDRQSLVKLTNQSTQTVSWQTTTDESEVTFGDAPLGHYDIEVSAVGYLTGHKEFQAITSFVPVK